MERVARGGRRRNDGFTLLEIMIALIIVSVALLGLLSLINSSSVVQDETRYRTIAYNAARQKIEEMRATAFAEIYYRYNLESVAGDDKLVTTGGTCPGSTFTIDGLPGNNAMNGKGLGTIYFPEDSPGKGLTESPTSKILQLEFGMPKDLNADGDESDTALTTYNLLPVKIEVQWVAVGGKTITLPVITYIGNRD